MKAQEWAKKHSLKTERLYINEQIEGELDLANFTKLKKVFISQSVDGSKIEIKNGRKWEHWSGKKEVEIIKLVDAQVWLEAEYPKAKRSEIEELNIEEKGLEGDLNLSDFVNLKTLNCKLNKITLLNISGCLNIEGVDAWSNQIKEIIGVEKLVKLQRLFLGDNQLEELDLTENIKLKELIFHTNPAIKVEIGDTSYFTNYSGENTILSWEKINKKQLAIVAEELSIKPEQIQNASVKEVSEKIVEAIKELKDSQKPDNLPSNWKELLDKIPGLEQRPDITNETWDDYKNRPSLEQYNSRPNTTVEDYNRLLNNQKPTDYDNIKDELDKWKNGLGGKNLEQVQTELGRITELEKRPTPEQLTANYLPKEDLQKEAEKLGMVSQEEYNKRPNITVADWNNDWSKRKPLTDYEKLQKELNKWTTNFLGQDPSELKGILDQKPPITKQQWNDDYSKRPKQTDLDKIQADLNQSKNDLKTVQDSLKGWTDKFPNKSPTQVDNENKKAGTVDGLQKELNTWKNGFPGKNPQMVAQEINNANQTKNELNNWKSTFPNKAANQVKSEMDQLKSRPTGAVLTSEQQQKLQDYEEMAKYLKRDMGKNWRAEVLAKNK